MQSLQKFEPFIHSISQTIHDLIDMKGLNLETITALYRHFTTQLVPFDDSAIQCEYGCGYCCHLKVSCSVPEILVIVNFLHANGQIKHYRQQFSTAPELIRQRVNKDDRWWIEHTVPCIFLDTEKSICSIYEVRPFSCRGYHSLDVNTCRQGYTDRTITPIPCYADLKRSREIYSIAFERAMKQRKLQSRQMELTSTLFRFIEEPGLSDKWLAGEQIFTRPHHLQTHTSIVWTE
jgi:Fe-S-cluster containining protein